MWQTSQSAPEEVFNIGDLLFTKHKQKDSYTKWDDNADTTRTSKINYMAAGFKFLLCRGPQWRSYEIFKCEHGYFYQADKQ